MHNNHLHVVNEKAGKKAFYSCSLSNKNPYCDGSHKGTEFSTEIIELKSDKTIAWCGCKHSKKEAFCDGTHKNL